MQKKEEIQDIIYNHYPKNHDSFLASYVVTDENKKLKNCIKIAENEIYKWENYINKLREITDNKYLIEDWTQLFNNDACYVCRLSYLSNKNEFINISINLSIISNYFSIYKSTTHKINGIFSKPTIDFRLSFIETDLIEKIKVLLLDLFENYEEFPLDLNNEIVTDVTIGNKNFGEATFFNCIFTTHVW